MRLSILLIGLACIGIEAVLHEKSGPLVNATKGEMFPQARIKILDNRFLIIDPDIFHFNVTKHRCDILVSAMYRYAHVIEKEARIALKSAVLARSRNDDGSGDLLRLDIDLENPCEELPYLHMNENYSLAINENSRVGNLRADAIWGILRGLESFSQLLRSSLDGYLMIRCQMIEDFPRFPHRGLALDTSSHYIPVEDIMLTLDAMSYNKLNVFHWHMIDDNSFPYESKVFPELSAKGAYHPSMVYTPKDVTEIVNHARFRGIRVIIEFDTPAHSKSLGKSYPELLTKCYENGAPNGKLGPLNPTKPEIFGFLAILFHELFQAFPDRHFHLGGNQVSLSCWASNPDVIEYMKKHNIYTPEHVEADYFQKLLKLTKAANVTPIVWEGVFTNVQDLSREVVVQIWSNPWNATMIDVLHNNHTAILSSCWHLGHLKNSANWRSFYTCEPLNFDGTPKMKSRVLGGEAFMRTTYVDQTNLHSRIWPRVSAVAERLWSNATYDTKEAAGRLEEHVCRMQRRGIGAEPPNGPGFCLI